MAETVRNKGGRPRVGATPITVRLAPEQLGRLDRWIDQSGSKFSRPMAMRILMERALQDRADNDDDVVGILKRFDSDAPQK